MAIESIDGRNLFQIKSAYVIPKSKFYVPSQHLPLYFKHNLRYAYISDLNLRNIKAADISVLLGAKIPEALIQSDVRIGSENNPTAVLTPFGWTLLGGIISGRKTGNKRTAANHTSIQNDIGMRKTVEAFWKTDSYPFYERNTALSIEDGIAYNRMESCTQLVDGKYQVLMLWKDSVYC